MINSIKRQIYLNESWIKPKTLVNLRWLAIVGQGVAIAVTDLVLGLTFNVEALNTHSWMGTRFPYWEGPISVSGDLSGVGYLEMTGY